MDFTDAYRLSASTSSHRSFAYSPGSTFFSTLHHLSDVGRTIVQIRVSTSLQVIRDWTLEFQATSSSWSKDGTSLLVVGKSELVVLAVDPGAGRRDRVDDNQGVVASIRVGMEGLANASWVGSGSQEALCVFSSDDVLASVYDIHRGSVLTIANPKRSRAFSSPTSQYIALLTRSNTKDGLIILASPNPRQSQEWRVEEQYVLQTNDAIEVAWSPDERYIALREGILEYKVHIYSPLGHLQSSFQIDSNPTQTQSSFTSVYSNVLTESTKTAGGGLGIREMKWRPDGGVLALGGFEEMVRILESTNWSMAACLDLSKKVVADSQGSNAMGSLMAWREPFDWRSETGGRGIVTYDQMDLPFSLPSLKIDMSSNTSSKSGICWMEWNCDGTLLGVRNDNHPAAVYVYAFPPIDPQEEDQRIQPYLLSVIMLSSSVTLATWKPAASHPNLQSSLAILTSQGQSINMWSYRGGSSPSQTVEAIPIPLDNFYANDFAFAPDGNKLLITSSNDTYCCAIEDKEGGFGLQDSHL